MACAFAEHWPGVQERDGQATEKPSCDFAFGMGVYSIHTPDQLERIKDSNQIHRLREVVV